MIEQYSELCIEDEFKVQSEPNSRTSSVKYRSRRLMRVTEIQEDTRRRNSLPLSTEIAVHGPRGERLEEKRQKIKRVRSFKMTSKGIKNDIEDERRLSTASIHSAISQRDIFRKRHSSEVSEDSAICSGCSSTSSSGYYRICIMGADAVGKTALANQFMKSDLLLFDSDSDDLDEQTLSVVVDGEESTLEFVDFSKHDFEIERLSVDAYIMVFSVHERSSFDVAKKYLMVLRNEMFSDRAIVLVANKVDLVRKRQITSEEAKDLAKQFDCKYIETSVAFNLQIDELLVGVLKQIKTQLNPESSEIIKTSSEGRRSKGPKGLLSKLFKRRSKISSDVLLIVK